MTASFAALTCRTTFFPARDLPPPSPALGERSGAASGVGGEQIFRYAPLSSGLDIVRKTLVRKLAQYRRKTWHYTFAKVTPTTSKINDLSHLTPLEL
jgi:hypothetical protein